MRDHDFDVHLHKFLLLLPERESVSFGVCFDLRRKVRASVTTEILSRDLSLVFEREKERKRREREREGVMSRQAVKELSLRDYKFYAKLVPLCFTVSLSCSLDGATTPWSSPRLSRPNLRRGRRRRRRD